MTYGEPRYDAQGRVEAVSGVSLDVTERVRADEALREREERLQRALAGTVAALGATVAMRDPYTSAHELRVAELATRIAASLGWSVEAVERLRIAALVHDIGKIAIPAEILSKPSRLTETEFALIKSHSTAAYEILAPIDFGGPVAEIVLQHHERLDGSGYPRRPARRRDPARRTHSRRRRRRRGDGHASTLPARSSARAGSRRDRERRRQSLRRSRQ